MPNIDHLRRRRAQFLERSTEPVLLFSGGTRSRNLPENHYPDRFDSNFLFFFERVEADSAAFFDPDAGEVTLFLPERTIERSLWTGALPDHEDMRSFHGVDRVCPMEVLEEHVPFLARGRPVRSLAVADSKTTARARSITGEDLDFHDPSKIGSYSVQDALAQLRMRKLEPELSEIRRAAEVSAEAFREAMRLSRPGTRERELCAAAERCFSRRGCAAAFTTILSVRGEVLHNHHHEGVLREGDLVLMDAGAEVPSGYAADVTRTWPASGAFTPEARGVYEIVLAAEKASIDAARSGARFRDLHLLAAKVIAEGLVDLGVLRGSPEGLVEQGAHALFFPHGVGHLLGLDAHDLESFGDRVLYGEGRTRSDQFGTAFLRIDLDLEPGMVVTIEPGVYFVREILRHSEFREQFASAVDFARTEWFLEANEGRGFGGIRIEDDVLITESDPEVLTSAIPKEASEVEDVIGEAVARAPAP